MQKRLIALDLDDTLLGQDATISPAHKVAVAAARAAGHDVTLVTARAWRGTRPYVAELGLTLPVICMTGAVVYTPEGKPLSQRAIPLADARRIAAWADAEGWSCRFYFADGRIYHSRKADDYFPTLPGHGYPIDQYVGDLAPCLAGEDEPIQAVTLGNRAVEGLLARLPELPDLVATTYDRGTSISRTHLMHRAVAKGPALAQYCAERSIPRESVIAIGDGETDRSMIEWAGTGVAMGWAPEAVRRAADLVTDPDDPAPVATALRTLLGF
jgi:Cof subfamily protein (haloacid dehalogenase superfamily)